jgi:CubicO group peptidase (beta-lactamase class C family)
MTTIFRLLCFFFCASIASAVDLPRSEPEAEGVSSVALLDLVGALDTEIDGMHSLMIVRHGKVIADGWWAPYSAESNHVLYSLSKSFTSTAVGFAVAEGKLKIFDKVVDIFPEAVPADASGNLKAMRVRDLLTMATGHQDEPPTSAEEMSVKSFLAQSVPHKPGTHFRYNTAATFMQSAIVQKVSGQTVLEYLRPRLFEPLGIDKPAWDSNFEGINLGGYGLRVRTEDIAKLGQLYLQKGEWNGKQLLPAEWVELATSRQMSNGSDPDGDWDQGYGFQFWRCRHNAYRGDGAFGQYCVVMPEQDVVIAVTSGVKNMPQILNVIWENLLPAMGTTEALPANEEGLAVLKKKLAGLELEKAKGQQATELSRKVLHRRFVRKKKGDLDGIRSVVLESIDEGKSVDLVMQVGDKEIRFPCGYGEWKKGRAPFSGGRLAWFEDEPVAGCFAWESDNTCLIKICAYETPFSQLIRLKFEEEKLTIDSEVNVAFGPTKQPTIELKLNHWRNWNEVPEMP